MGVVISSVIWQTRIKQLVSFKNIEIAQLEGQIRDLREEKTTILHPSPTPIPIPYVKKENLTGTNIYSLDCFDSEKEKPTFSWIGNLEIKLEENEKLVYLCFNEELNKTALISQKESEPGGYGSPAFYALKLQVFSIPGAKLELLRESEGSYLGGWCSEIIAWTKTGNIYYKCGGGDGPWTSYSVFKISSQTKEIGIVESCFSFENKKTCNYYCESNNDCQQGYFCDLESSLCVQSCRTDDDCGHGPCRGFGPKLGCEIIQ